MPPTRAATRCEFIDRFVNGVATSNSLYKEIDGVYTLFFKDNKVAWQIGVSYLSPARCSTSWPQGMPLQTERARSTKSGPTPNST